MAKTLAQQIADAANALRESDKIAKDANAVARYRQYTETKKTNPHAAAMMINAWGNDLDRGRELAKELEGAAAKAEQDQAVETRAHLLAAQLLTKPPQGSAPPTPAPAA